MSRFTGFCSKRPHDGAVRPVRIMRFARFVFAAVRVHVGCMGSFSVGVENKGLLDSQLREFLDDLFGSREAHQVFL